VIGRVRPVRFCFPSDAFPKKEGAQSGSLSDSTPNLGKLSLAYDGNYTGKPTSEATEKNWDNRSERKNRHSTVAKRSTATIK
jgi:hypothetical protein